MALTADQIKEIESYQSIIANLVAILQQQIYITSEQAERGLSQDNIDSINTTIDKALAAIDGVIDPVTP